MELIINCQNAGCHKSFLVLGLGKRSDYAGVREVRTRALCPHCQTAHSIIWPKGVKIFTAPNVELRTRMALPLAS